MAGGGQGQSERSRLGRLDSVAPAPVTTTAVPEATVSHTTFIQRVNTGGGLPGDITA